MEEADIQLERSVWQRVLGQEASAEPSGDGADVYAEAEAEAAYRMLSRRMPRYGEAFSRMADDAHRHGAVLRGICRMRTEDCTLTAVPGPGDREQILPFLRRCYHRSLRLERDYGKKVRSEEFGCVYARLRDDQQRHMTALLEIFGNKNLTGK